ncbi:aspartyl/asparaginyl beta-hydroxylase [Rhodanobacter sp. 115]|nr:aspartyl/asparaginyl beta-hydroxylase [Rhodanobacter sp. 115]
MDFLSPRFIILYVLLFFVLCVLLVHLRGRARLRFDRQLVDHSAIFAPYNLLMYAFSAVPARPILDRRGFPQLDLLQANWQTIRDEALALFDDGHIRAAEKHNDASFNSFFKQGWKRFYLKWYGEPLASAEALCPKTVALLRTIPGIKAAMFATLAPNSRLNPHRDPFAGSLRYHLGLITPNSRDCRIFVDGEEHAWGDGQGRGVRRDLRALGGEQDRPDPGDPVRRRGAPAALALDDRDQSSRGSLHGQDHRVAKFRFRHRKNRFREPHVRVQPAQPWSQPQIQAQVPEAVPRREVHRHAGAAVGDLPRAMALRTLRQSRFGVPARP